MQNGTNIPETPAPAAYRGEPRYEVPPQRRRDLPYKQGWLAGLLSGLFPGLGQVYVGYYRHGIVIATIFVVIITGLAGGDLDGLEPLLGMSIGFTWLYGIVDAARRAQAVNRALDGMAGHELPEDMELPGAGGSMVGGVLLVILGIILVAHTRFDVDMEWLADWWPLALIGFGGWLIYKARAEKSARDESAGSYGAEGGASREI
jgi:hypothetical protein